MPKAITPVSTDATAAITLADNEAVTEASLEAVLQALWNHVQWIKDNGSGGTSDIPAYLFDASVRSVSETVGSTTYTNGNSNRILKFRTSATSLIVNVLNRGLGAISWRTLNVRVNGVNYTTIDPVTQDAVNALALTLPAGEGKLVEITEPLQSRPGGTTYARGCTVLSITGECSFVGKEHYLRKLAVYGDSITVGDGATFASRDSAWMLARTWYPGLITIVGWGYRGICSETSLDTLADELVAAVAGASTREVWLAIGRNDYGLAQGDAITYGSQLASLCDKIHERDPGIRIWLQSQLGATDEGLPNVFGNLPTDYRAFAQNVASERSKWVTFLDGTTVLNTGTDLADGVHPNNAGHAKWAAFAHQHLINRPLLTDAATVHYHDPRHGLTLVSGDASELKDQYGGHDLTQVTAGNRPTYGTILFNGWPALQYNTADFMTAADAPEYEVGQGTWFWMGALRYITSTGFICFFGKSSGADAAHIRVMAAGANRRPFIVWGNDASNYTVSNLAITLNANTLLGVGVDSSTSEVIYMVDDSIERLPITLSGTGSNAQPFRIHGDVADNFANDTIVYAGQVFANYGLGQALPSATLTTLRDGFFKIRYNL